MSFRVALVSLHTSPTAHPGAADAGGMNVFLVGLAEALAARDIEVELISRATSPGEADAASATTPQGVPVRFLPAGPLTAVAKNRLVPLAGAFGRALSALPRFDMVHSHYWLSGLAALPVAEAWGAPHVQSLHTVAAVKNEQLADGDSPESAERLDGERMLTRSSALTIAATAAERDAIERAYGAPAHRLVVVAPGVDTGLFHPGPRKAPGRPIAVMLARIQPLKAPDLAIAAIAAIPAERRPRLVIAGGTSPGHDDYAGRLRRQVEHLGLAADVTFLPPQSRAATAELLRVASVLLVPSFSETFGLVALEAAASGTPTIAFRTGGLAESVVDGVSGILLPTRDPDAWGRAIDALLHDPTRLAALSAGASAHAERHTWARAADETAAHYERLLAGNATEMKEPDL
ncbi:glycosyltransferase [Herbiconiux daphne]|uniref:D-inositol 3-phosphate glycosyltransferase n=1 Tax=Herbiconiux daphne TaxID=2970914 RepID=A0ABT2H631_9MICO|nr:glycosyltransferase [Herbiconiux daphne]MCS5735388.1 glycosyltransferase [Herbiconiux daphne]